MHSAAEVLSSTQQTYAQQDYAQEYAQQGYLFVSQLDLPAGWTTRTTRDDQVTAPSLAVGWTTGVDEASGATYYYHAETGHSQWDPPSLG